MLILLKFYAFFSAAPYDNFVAETDDMLCSCGYSPLHMRNPFDWISMHCAAADAGEIIPNYHPSIDRFQSFCRWHSPLTQMTSDKAA